MQPQGSACGRGVEGGVRDWGGVGGFSGFRVRGIRVLVCLWMRASGSCDLRLWRLRAWLVV